MSTLLIEGGRPLSGAIAVEGNKNAALPLLAACLLTQDECVLENVPRIRDVEVMAAGRAAGLVDNKVVSFSETHTSLRLVIPVKERPRG